MGNAVGQGDTISFSRADAEFHALLFQIAGNGMLEHLYRIVAAALQDADDLLSGCNPRNNASLAHHAQIVDALDAGNGSAAEAVMRQLLTDHAEARPGLPAQRNS